jgi:DNA polymerase III delta prime subunit
MKLTPYKTLLTMGKEAINAALAPVRAMSAKKKAELEIAKLDERMATLESELNDLCSVKEIDYDKIINKLDEIALAERRKKQFEKIVNEMFPD